jgi:K+-transporting ATPase KdpF subunit
MWQSLLRSLCCCGVLQKHPNVSREISMEYAIAGIVAAGLFVYLMYALLRPERF